MRRGEQNGDSQRALKSVGLKYSDVETVNLPLPDHVAALANKRSTPRLRSSRADDRDQERFCRAGEGRRRDHAEPPDRGAAYSETFCAQDRCGAALHARLSARSTFLQRRARGGRMAGPNADEVIAIQAESTGRSRTPAIYKAITPTGMNPDGKVNVRSLARMRRFIGSKD
jgi:hypothetical protein